MLPQADTLLLDLNGNFSLSDGSGQRVILSGDKTRALIALIASSTDGRRARPWLKAVLYPESDDEQASQNLRKLLGRTRDALGEFSHVIRQTRLHIELVNFQNAPTRNDETFFEDAPTSIGEAFEDWLRQERARSQPALRTPVFTVFEPLTFRVNIAVAPPITEPDHDSSCRVAASAVTDRIVHGLRAHDILDVFDLRDLDGDQISARSRPEYPRLVVRLRATRLYDALQIALLVLDPSTDRVEWSETLAFETRGGGGMTRDEIIIASAEAVDGVINALHRPSSLRVEKSRGRAGLFQAIHHVVGMSRNGQQTARLILSDIEQETGSAVAAGWYAFTFANILGEGGHSRFDDEMMEAASNACGHAMALDPANGLTMALTSHVYGFVLRRYDLAADLAAGARTSAPQLPIVWDLSAMNAIYCGRFDEAHAYATMALRLGRHSPYRTLFESSFAISATLIGRHDVAIRAYERLLARQPNFLAAQRHAVASYAALGFIERADVMIEAVQRVDSDFTFDAIGADEYPLLSPRSIQLTREAFQLTGKK